MRVSTPWSSPLDDQAQRDDIELVVVEATERYARNLGENGE